MRNLRCFQRRVSKPWLIASASLAVALIAGSATTIQAQSITRGTIEGQVLDSIGQPMAHTRVLVTHMASGVTRTVATDAEGAFAVPLLPPGRYAVVAEELGYQPTRVEDVPVLPGRTETLQLSLEPVALPVQQIEENPFRGRVAYSKAGVSQWLDQFAVNQLPENRRVLGELGRLSSVFDEQLAAEGLPGWLSNVAVGGILFGPARHPDLAPSPLATSAFSLSGFEAAELLYQGLDVEWSETAGGILSAYPRQGTATPTLRAYADWSGSALTTSDHFDAEEVDANSLRAGALLSGPIIDDTAHYVIGIEGRSLEIPLPPAWAIDALDSELLSAAAAEFGVDLRPYTQTRVFSTQIASGFGRFDWAITDNHALSVHADASAFEAGGSGEDPGLEPERIASIGSKIDGWDLSTGVTVASNFGGSVGQELRFGVQRSERDYEDVTLLGTRIIDGGLAFGTDPTFPARIERLGIRASETLHLMLGSHQLKGGLSLLFTAHQQRYVHSQFGEFAFGGVSELRSQTGRFRGHGGAFPIADFQNWQVAAYLQDTWSATPGLELLFGLRYEYEILDDEELPLNDAWLAQTGIDNTRVDETIGKWSPRFGLFWDIGDRHQWLVHVTAGLFHDRVDAGDFSEAIAQSGRFDFRRGLGVLDSWPGVPSRSAAPALGPRLTVLASEFEPPRTARSSLGLTRIFSPQTTLHISGTYRYTDRLVRRHDLNLLAAPTARDQHGRPIFGQLEQHGSLIAVIPGSNRRFPEFDLVSALNADGDSEYWGGTIGIDQRAGRWVDLIGRYTFSTTDDNWISAGIGGPEAQLTPFPDSLAGIDWAEGRSDFDVPHRLTLGAQLKLPALLAGGRIAVFYRLESGRPFTPGFRRGVDVNGDGSGLNDPAFIDVTVPGIETLLGEWDCLADQVGTFAERNSCRGPDIHRIDARLALGLSSFQGHPIEVVVDVLNVADSDTGLRDGALYLIDRGGNLQTGPDGTVTLPLVANPNFGEALVRHSIGRTLRFGIRYRL